MPPRNSDLPIIYQNGKFRLQLSNMRITDDGLPLLLERAKQQLMDLYRPQQRQQQQQASEVRFEDVPLIEITLNRNLLTDAAMPVVVDFLLANQHIESFELLGNQLTDASAPLVQSLMQRSQLHRIKVGDNQFTADGARVIADGLRDAHSGFVQLHVGGNPIGDEGVTALCNACQNSHVEVLGLRDVKMLREGWGSIGGLCFYNGANVQEIQLKGNVLSDAATECLVTAAERATAALPTFRSPLLILSMPNCAIGGAQLQRLSLFITLHHRLTQLDLSSNPLGDAGMLHLVRWLEGGSAGAMRSLNLQRTQLTCEGVNVLAGIGKQGNQSRSCPLSCLRDLDLSFNELTVEGTPAATRIVESCPNLERFSVHRCLLGGASLPEFCRAVASHPNLRDLDFSSNYSGEWGAAWEGVLQHAKRLDRLLLTDNEMPANITGSIVNCVVHNLRTTMKSLQIGGQSKIAPLANAVLPAVHCALAQALALNRGEARVYSGDRGKGGSTATNDNTQAPAKPTKASGGAPSQQRSGHRCTGPTAGTKAPPQYIGFPNTGGPSMQQAACGGGYFEQHVNLPMTHMAAFHAAAAAPYGGGIDKQFQQHPAFAFLPSTYGSMPHYNNNTCNNTCNMNGLQQVPQQMVLQLPNSFIQPSNSGGGDLATLVVQGSADFQNLAAPPQGATVLWYPMLHTGSTQQQTPTLALWR